MRNPDTLIETIADTTDIRRPSKFSLSVPKDVGDRYNKDFEEMKSKMRTLHAGDKEQLSYKSTLVILFAIRLACLFTAFEGNVPATLLISSLQFLFAPYSLFVSFALCLALAPPIYLCHYMVFTLLTSLTNLVSPLLWSLVPDMAMTTIQPWLSVNISPAFIILFFLADQLLCLYCHLMTPCKQFTLKETLTHVIWGFLNTKTYTLVLLVHMMQAGVSIPLLLWIIEWKLQLTLTVSTMLSSRLMHWLELFYTQHRIAHLPKVYEHAHKLHHYLHGTLAFDAHIYGNGMPEEFFFLLLELCMGVYCGLMPASLNRLVLQYSVDNKFGHTQWLEDDAGQNFHADHHLVHVKNYGIYNSLMDMYFNTSTFNDTYRIKPSLYCDGADNIVFEVSKKISNDSVTFEFNPIDKKVK